MICPYCHIEMNSRLKKNYSFIQHIKIENLGKITPITVTVPQAQIHSCTQCKYCAIESLNSEGLTSTDTLMTIEIPDEYEDVYAP